MQYFECSLLLLVIAAADLPLRTIVRSCCSDVFCVTLSLLVINTSSTVCREQKTTPLTIDECRQLATVRRSCVHNTWRSNRWQRTEARYWPRMAIFAIYIWIRRLPRQNIAVTFGVGKLEWCGYPTVEKFENIFIRFDREHESDWHLDIRTDGQTDRHPTMA